jgi:hypothetical protein
VGPAELIYLTMPFLVHLRPAAGALLCLALFIAPPSAVAVETWLDTLAHVAADTRIDNARENFIAKAREDAALSILHRPRTLAELRDSAIPMKYREKPAHMAKLDDEAWARMALSLGDSSAGTILADRLPRMAAAATLSGDKDLTARVVAQLDELAGWEPLQRPGVAGGASWLGTGWLIRAITQSTALLPPGSLPDELRARLDARLNDEINRIVEDWKSGRAWYVRQDAPYTNQWTVPTEGLIHAALFVGREKRGDAYEMGVKNMLRTLDAQGPMGECVEGLAYSNLTVSSLLYAAEDCARVGDRRLVDHPFLQNYPRWGAHHLMPGGFHINAFDGGSSLNRQVLAQFVALTGSTDAAWVLQTRGQGTAANTLHGLLALAADVPSDIHPPLWAAYPVAEQVNWRSSWDDDSASGLWIRGGHETDSHDHMDRGHVNFIVGKRPVLIEAGSTSYGSPDYLSFFKSVAGHNVLQVGSTAPSDLTPDALRTAGQILDREHRSAPITVHRLDAEGGDITVDASGCYTTVTRWTRRVTWTKDTVDIQDVVELKTPDLVTFRWHLGASANASAHQSAGLVSIDGINVGYSADSAVTAHIVPMPDQTLNPKGVTQHACVVLQSETAVSSFKLHTTVSLKSTAPTNQ